VPGLYIVNKSGPFDYSRVALMGSRTEDVLWLEDGVRLNNRLYGGGTTPLDTLPASMIERIEVVEGPQALFYGTQSVAGAINIITRDFSDHLDGAITVGGDTNSSVHLDGYVRDKVGPGQLVAYASHDESKGFLPFPEGDFQPSATMRDRAYDMTSLGGKYAINVSDQVRLTVSEQHNFGRLDDGAPQLVETAYNDRNEDILTGKLDVSASQDLQLYIKGYYHWWRSHYTEFDNDLANPGTLDTVEDNGPWGFVDRGVNAMGKYSPVRGINVYLGYDFQDHYGSDAVLVISKHSESANAVFGEIATTPDLIHNLTLAAGVRYNDPSVGQSATVGDVSARYDLGDGLYIKAMAGTAFRLPTAEELFANDPDDERGDPTLKPETSRNANISIGGHAPGLLGLHWEAIGFFRDVKNLIDYATFDPTTNQDVFGNVPGTVRVRGGEAVIDGALTDEISGSASYTYSSAKQDGGVQIANIPKSLAKATLDYHPTEMPFGLTATLNYVGSVYNDPIGTGPINFGDYVVFNASARIFLDKDQRQRVDIGLNNVFNKRYASELTTGVSDATGDAYVVPDLGQPRTFMVRYTFGF
ncbi:MAG TPA: TonB-dependent receptor, partial [Caulobacteraceae bacterium]|nr:TonB-dependent receptor [Caulobacteraceae bacterium]